MVWNGLFRFQVSQSTITIRPPGLMMRLRG
jgi:hypothetical protein